MSRQVICQTCKPAVDRLYLLGELAKRARTINHCIVNRYENRLERCVVAKDRMP